MTGLKIKICFWYLDASVVEDVLKILKDGEDCELLTSASNDRAVLSRPG